MGVLLGAFPGSPPSSIPPSKPSPSSLAASAVFEALKSLPNSSVSRRLKVHNPSSSPPSDGCTPSVSLLALDASAAGIISSSPVSSVGCSGRLRGLFKSSWGDCVQLQDDFSQSPLKYFTPFKVDGDVAEISPPAEVLNQMEAFWDATLVGYFCENLPHFHAVNCIARKIWAKFGLSHVAVNPSSFFFFRFSSSMKMNLCLQKGPWTLVGKPISLKIWSPGSPLVKENFDSWPIWISLLNVPVEFWSPIGLSWIASSVGKPLLLHPHTAKMERLYSARVCVEVKIGSCCPLLSDCVAICLAGFLVQHG